MTRQMATLVLSIDGGFVRLMAVIRLCGCAVKVKVDSRNSLYSQNSRNRSNRIYRGYRGYSGYPPNHRYSICSLYGDNGCHCHNSRLTTADLTKTSEIQ